VDFFLNIDSYIKCVIPNEFVNNSFTSLPLFAKSSPEVSP